MVLLAYVGTGIVIIGSLGFLIATFKTSIWWGIGCILFSPISLVFLFMHWTEAKNPFFLQLVGIAVIFAVASMSDVLDTSQMISTFKN